jgi:hypothetical protein
MDVKIIHPELGPDLVAEVPQEALPHHYASGWRLLAEDEAPEAEAAAEPEPMTKAQAAKAAKQAAKAATAAESEGN